MFYKWLKFTCLCSFLTLCGTLGWSLQCPPLKQWVDIQKQYQLQLHAVLLSPSSEEWQHVRQLLKANAPILEKMDCYTVNEIKASDLRHRMGLMRLLILQNRIHVIQNEDSKVEQVMEDLRKIMEAWLLQPSSLARRLGKSARGLFLDEVAFLIGVKPELADRILQSDLWRADIVQSIQKEMEAYWNKLIQQLPLDVLQPENLAQFYSRQTKGAPIVSSRLGFHLLKLLRAKEQDSLNQISRSFQSKPLQNNQFQCKYPLITFLSESSPVNSVGRDGNLLMNETDSYIHYYLSEAMRELKKNNSLSLEKWLAPLLDKKTQALRQEMGEEAWSLISSLVSDHREGDEIHKFVPPHERLTSTELVVAENRYAKVHNPLGRFYELLFLKKLRLSWTTQDVLQLKLDQDRLASLHTLRAIQKFEREHLILPSSLKELVNNNYLKAIPKDHFFGQEVKYSREKKKIWTVGSNGIDEQGWGDDMGVRIKR